MHVILLFLALFVFLVVFLALLAVLLAFLLGISFAGRNRVRPTSREGPRSKADFRISGRVQTGETDDGLDRDGDDPPGSGIS